MIGYVHTGIEKTAEDKAYWKVIPVVERMDYLAYFFNAMAFCNAVETLLELEVPPRAQYLRVLHMELNRIMSHLVWLGTSALDLGAISMFWYCFRDREQILDLFEMSTGQRMHTRYIQVGGVIEDIPVGFAGEGARVLRADAGARRPVPRPAGQERDRAPAPARRRGARRRRRCSSYGVTGPLLRASGNSWDLRKAAPYSSYDDFEFKIPVGTTGDNWDRFAVRAQEMKESVRDHRAGARRPARRAVHHREPQVRAAAAPRAGDLDGGADPPLQARHRGLPRAAGRGVLADRVARAASSAASCARTDRPSPRACTCATRRS